jgi:hypothetical protein
VVRVLLVGGPADGAVHELPDDHVRDGRAYHLVQYTDDSPRTGDALYSPAQFRDMLHHRAIYAHSSIAINKCQYNWTASRELESGTRDKEGLILLTAAAINRALQKCFVALENEGFTLIPGFHIGDATEGLTPMPGLEPLFDQQIVQVAVKCLAYRVTP